MKLSTRVALVILALPLLAGCDPKEPTTKIPGVNAPFPVLYVLGDIYNDKHQPMQGVPVEIRGTATGHGATVSSPVAVSPGCTPAANDAMICNTPNVQVMDMTSVESFTFTYRFLTNIKGWQVGCQISATRTGAGRIFDQERSDLTSATNQEVLATCSYP